MKDPHPTVRRWSSLTRLSSSGATAADKPCPSGRAAAGGVGVAGGNGVGVYRCDVPPHGSLDRGLLYGGYLRQDPPPLGGAATASAMDPYHPPPSSLSLSSQLGLQLRSPGADPRYHRRYDPAAALRRVSLGVSPAPPPPAKPSSLDLSYSALPESRGPGGAGGGGGSGPVLPGQRGGGGGVPLGHQAPGGSPIQPAVRTQMWLSEQMEYRPAGPELAGVGVGVVGGMPRTPQEAGGGVGGPLSLPLPWQQEQQQRERLRQEAELSQMLAAASLPVNTLVKIKEGLLRQRELEIDRQKQQILQLHARIRENELRAQQVLHTQRGRCEESYILKTTQESPPYDSPLAPPPQLPDRPLCCEGGELGRKLAAAEMEVIHLNEFLKQNAQKYGEDVKKLEEKMKTRDRYISSLKKKVQREAEQNQEKQQRIETLEKYLADLPSLDEVQTQAQQLEEVQKQTQGLEEQVCELERGVAEGRSLLQEKEELAEKQGRREKELMAAVHSLQAKVEQCLEDGVRLDLKDLKQLEEENGRLVDQQGASRELITNQKKQIEKLTLELTAAERRLQQERDASEELRSRLKEKESVSRTLQNQRPAVEGASEAEAEPKGAEPLLRGAGPLLREMSLCLLDLRALCSILTQRAQGEEPNLALLLGIKSMSVSGEENDGAPREEEGAGPRGEEEEEGAWLVEEGAGLVEGEEGLRAKLAEVGRLRNDVDALRTAISDRYAQDMGDNCVTQ